MIRRIAQILATLSLLLTAGGAALAEMRLNLQDPQTVIAHEIYDLHNFMLLICTVIFIAVFGVMFYSIVKHRKSVGHQAANFHESTTVEIALDRRAVPDRHRHGAAGDQGAGRHEGHLQPPT